MNFERRYTGPSDSRVQAETRAGSSLIAGYSAVFYSGSTKSEYRLADDILERIRPGAFDRAIAEKHDARALFNHDANNLLGRVSSGTCRLTVDSVGLRYEVTVNPNDPDHARVLAKIKRGDLTGSSFAFRPIKTAWEDKGDVSIRWIEDLVLYDVGPVVYPAYEAATTGLRDDELKTIATERANWPALQLRLAQLKLVEMQSKVRRDDQCHDLDVRKQMLAKYR